MVVTDIRTLLDKLNGVCQKSFQTSVGVCVSNTNYELTWEHLLTTLLDETDGDIAHILRYFGVDIARLKKSLTNEIEGFPRGNTAKPSFSPSLISLLEAAWGLGSLRYGMTQVRSGVLFAAAFDEMKRSIAQYAAELRHIDDEMLKKELLNIVGKSSENIDKVARESGDPALNKTELEKYCKNLTADAKAGKTDPIIGRDSEIFQVIDILSRRRKNNPILVGEAGVGKTAIMEGLAQQIAAGSVPASLKDVELWELDLGLLQAGASVKGEFEKRLKSVIDIAKKSGGRIILFIDEAHTLIGAGGAAGTGDAANLLKPALARGTLRTIAATTWAEYKRYIEKDAALTRRFQVIKVEEPSEEKAVLMIRGLSPVLEKHHKVDVLDQALVAAAQLSHRYIPARQLPDKAVSLIDTACARVAISRTTTPPAIEYRKKLLADANRALKTLNKDKAAGIAYDEKAIVKYEEL